MELANGNEVMQEKGMRMTTVNYKILLYAVAQHKKKPVLLLVKPLRFNLPLALVTFES